MNGTIIDIPGIAVSVTPFSMQDSTDMAYVIAIKDGSKTVLVNILFGKIQDTCIK